jgi:hypothetical protein
MSRGHSRGKQKLVSLDARDMSALSRQAADPSS